MKRKVFDVVELQDGNRATILKVSSKVYKVETVNRQDITQGIQEITENEIKKIVFSKNT